MVRLAVLLCFLGGCDYVLQLYEVDQPPPAACGPYGDPQPLMFTGFTGTISDFSANADGSLATVVTGMGPAAAVVDSPNVWKLDGPHSAGLSGLSTSPVSAHLTFAPNDMFAGVRSPATALREVHRFAYTTQWNALAGADSVVASDPFVDVVVGNEVEVGPPPDNVTSFATVLLGPDSTGAYQLRMRVKRPGPSPTWRDDLEMEQLNMAGTPGQAVVTADVLTLVYASKASGAATSDLYVSHRESSSKVFDVGVKLGATVDTADSDEVEPWIDATCQTLYFRRRAAGNPADPGTIFIAHALASSGSGQ